MNDYEALAEDDEDRAAREAVRRRRQIPTLETVYETLADSDYPEDVMYGEALREAGRGPSVAVKWSVELDEAIREKRADRDFTSRLRKTIKRNRAALVRLSDVSMKELQDVADLGRRADELISQYYDDLSIEELEAEFEAGEPVKVHLHPLGVLHGFQVTLTMDQVRTLRRRAGERSLPEWMREAALNYDPGVKDCAHCGRLLGVSYGVVNGEYLCHTGTVPPQEEPRDCYRLVTVYGEGLGSRICQCCTFGNHDIRCTCDGSDCCHPEAYQEYNPDWGHGR